MPFAPISKVPRIGGPQRGGGAFSRDGLPLCAGYRRVPVDELGHHAAERLDAQRQWRDVEEQHVLDLALQHARLDRCAECHDLVRVDALVRLAPEDGLHRVDDLRHAGHPADQHDFVELIGLEPCILQRRLARPHGAGDEVIDQRLELGAR